MRSKMTCWLLISDNTWSILGEDPNQRLAGAPGRDGCCGVDGFATGGIVSMEDDGVGENDFVGVGPAGGVSE